MDADFRELIDLLHTEVGICRDLLEAMEREQAAMLRSQLEPLRALAAEKEAVIQRMQGVERQREEWVGRLAERLGCDAAELPLSRLAQEAPPALRTAFVGCRVELSGLVERLRTENHRSAVLFNHSAELLQSFYAVVKGLAGKGTVYQPGGRMQAARLNGKLLSHET
jgi:flagellar biosynthesis/type III secretory pathway chaperone